MNIINSIKNGFGLLKRPVQVDLSEGENSLKSAFKFDFPRGEHFTPLAVTNFDEETGKLTGKGNQRLKLAIPQIKEIKEYCEDKGTVSNADAVILSEKYGCGNNTIRYTIIRIYDGDYDKYIKEYDSAQSAKETVIKLKDNLYLNDIKLLKSENDKLEKENEKLKEELSYKNKQLNVYIKQVADYENEELDKLRYCECGGRREIVKNNVTGELFIGCENYNHTCNHKGVPMNEDYYLLYRMGKIKSKYPLKTDEKSKLKKLYDKELEY